MPNWSARPKEKKDHLNLTLLRTPVGSGLTGIVTCDQMIGCDTHYYEGRTIPCESPSCQACEAGIGTRWHGYLSIWSPKTTHHAILELTADASEEVYRYYELAGTLRGCMLSSRRKNAKNNSPIEITTKPANLAGLALPPPPNLADAMCLIWYGGKNAHRIVGYRGQQPQISIDSAITTASRHPADRLKLPPTQEERKNGSDVPTP